VEEIALQAVAAGLGLATAWFGEGTMSAVRRLKDWRDGTDGRCGQARTRNGMIHVTDHVGVSKPERAATDRTV
jgi:hypothetical protein